MNARMLIVPFGFVLLLGSAATARAAEPLGSPVDYLTVAQIAAQRGEWMQAERIVRDGMEAHPDSDGFHLSLGYVLENQGKIADAFYEYQWEVIRSAEPRLANEAARKIGLLLERPDADEPRRVMAAIALAETEPAKARVALAAIRRTRGDRFALRMFEAECAMLAGDTAAAQTAFRELIAKDGAFIPGYLALAQLLEPTSPKEAKQLRDAARAINPGHPALR